MMPAAIVQSKQGSTSGNSLTITLDSAATIGNVIVAFGVTTGGPTGFGVTTWQSVSVGTSIAYWATVVSSSASVVFTSGGRSSPKRLTVLEVSGLVFTDSASTPSATASGASNTADAGTVTPSVTSAIFSLWNTGAGTYSSGPTNGLTRLSAVTGSGATTEFGYLLSSSTGISSAITWTASVNWEAISIALRCVSDLSGSTSLTFALSGTSTADGVLAASSALTFQASAGVEGVGSASSSVAFGFSPVGDVTGEGVLQSTVATSFSLLGSPDVPSLLSASSTVSFAASASSTGIGEVSGTSAVSFLPTGEVSGVVDLASDILLSFSVSASLVGWGVLDTEIAFTFVAHAHPDQGVPWFAECVPPYLVLTTEYVVVSELVDSISTESVLLQRISFVTELVLSLEYDSVMLESWATQLRTGWYDG